MSLSGAVRPVAQAAARLKEAAKLGFTRAFAPRSDGGSDLGLALTSIGNLTDLVADIAASGRRAKGPPPHRGTRRVTRPRAPAIHGALRHSPDSAGFRAFRCLPQGRSMPITLLDAILLVVMLISALLAMVRGFMRGGPVRSRPGRPRRC